MGFCKRCGEITTGARCTCGGTAVAPALQWNPAGSASRLPDRWSQTYVTKPRERSPVHEADTAPGPVSAVLKLVSDHGSTPSTSSIRRFPRPQSTSGPVNVNSRVSAHIDRTTTIRPSSPLKHTYSPDETSTDILPSPHGSVLAKAYGSVLQPKETLASFTCSICATPFPPDATIYPDPKATQGNSRFLCRPCFSANGGSKGDCQSCHKPVLVLKSEGGFIENSERLWHKRCFRCEGCFKDISDHPMVDLLGKPSCAECFETCLKRDSPRRHDSPRAERDEKRSNMGGMKGSGSRQASPALEELEQRLGTLTRSRGSSPVVENKQRTPGTHDSSPLRDSPTRSPLVSVQDDSPFLNRIRMRANSEIGTPSPSSRSGDGSVLRRDYDRVTSSDADSPTTSARQVTSEAIEEMKSRLLISARSSPLSSPKAATSSPKESPRTPQSRIPIATRKSVSPVVRSPASTTSLRSDYQFLSFTDPLCSSVTPSQTKSSVNSPGSDILCSELLSTPEPKLHAIPTRTLRTITSTSSLQPEVDLLLSTPELGSDFSDSTSASHSSGPPTPPTLSPSSYQQQMAHSKGTEQDSDFLATTPTPKSKRALSGIAMPTITSSVAKCTKCNTALFGKFVKVPDDNSSSAAPKMYHTHCFLCSVCGGVFRDYKDGQAVFVKAEIGVCHVNCAPKEKVTKRPIASTAAANMYLPSKSNTSSRYEVPLTSAPAASTHFPKFGGGTVCPGCQKSVSPMERGVVPGPSGTRWHSTCLVCGGKDSRGRAGRRGKDEPGCGKKLDSAAKSDGEGGVWCRECLLLLPPLSPVRSPLVPSHTGSIWAVQNKGIEPEYTGTTTIARQFTGMGGGDSLIRQMTGGSLSPTRPRSASPTKQLGMVSGTKYPQPKSVIAMRSEGRGMQLVQQMTGSRGGDFGH